MKRAVRASTRAGLGADAGYGARAGATTTRCAWEHVQSLHRARQHIRREWRARQRLSEQLDLERHGARVLRDVAHSILARGSAFHGQQLRTLLGHPDR
jgi:hypothetical protein